MELLRVFQKYGAISSMDKYLDEEDSESRYLDIVLFGHYSGGKSSFLNAIFGISCGDLMLPVGKKPTTHKCWKLSYGRSQKVEMCAENGKILESLSVAQIRGLSEEKNKTLHHKIDHFHGEIPSPLLKPQRETVLIWDTPGFNDPSKYSNYNELIQLIHKSEIAVLVGSYEKILSDATKEFLLKMSSMQSQFLIVITNAEGNERFLDEKARYREEVEKFLRSVLSTRTEFEIFCIDSKMVRKQLKALYSECMDDRDLFNMINVLEKNGWRRIYAKLVDSIERADEIIQTRIKKKYDAEIAKCLKEIDATIDARKSTKSRVVSDIEKLKSKKIKDNFFARVNVRQPAFKGLFLKIVTDIKKSGEQKKKFIQRSWLSRSKSSLKRQSGTIADTLNDICRQEYKKQLKKTAKKVGVKVSPEAYRQAGAVYTQCDEHEISLLWKPFIKGLSKEHLSMNLKSIMRDPLAKELETMLVNIFDWDAIDKRIEKEIQAEVQQVVDSNNAEIDKQIENRLAEVDKYYRFIREC